MKKIAIAVFVVVISFSFALHAGQPKRSVKAGMRALESGDYWEAANLALDGLDGNPKLKKAKKLLAETKTKGYVQKMQYLEGVTDPTSKADVYLEIDRYITRCSRHGHTVDPEKGYSEARDLGLRTACETLYQKAQMSIQSKRYKVAYHGLTAIKKYDPDYKDCSSLITSCLEMGRVRVEMSNGTGPHQSYAAMLTDSVMTDFGNLSFTTADGGVSAPTTLELKVSVVDFDTEVGEDTESLNVYFNHVTRHDDGTTTTRSSSETVRLRSQWKRIGGSVTVKITNRNTGKVFGSKRFPVSTQLGHMYIDSNLRDPVRAYSVFNAEKVERARNQMNSGGDTVDKIKSTYEVYDKIKDETRKETDFEQRYGFPFRELIVEYESYQRTGRHKSLPSDSTLFRRAMGGARVWIQDQLEAIDSIDFTAD